MLTTLTLCGVVDGRWGRVEILKPTIFKEEQVVMSALDFIGESQGFALPVVQLFLIRLVLIVVRFLDRD